MSIFGDAIGGLGDFIAPIAGQVLDPLNITGVNSGPQGPSNNAQIANAWQQRHAARAVQPQPYAPADYGFLGSMLGDRGHSMAGGGISTQPQPASGWSAQPGKAPVWMDSHRTDRTGPNPTSQRWETTAEAPGSIFKGNRI